MTRDNLSIIWISLFSIIWIRQKLSPPTSYVSVFIGERTIYILLEWKNSLLTARTFCQMYFGLHRYLKPQKRTRNILILDFFFVYLILFWHSQENRFFLFVTKVRFSDTYLIITEILFYFIILLDFDYRFYWELFF